MNSNVNRFCSIFTIELFNDIQASGFPLLDYHLNLEYMHFG